MIILFFFRNHAVNRCSRVLSIKTENKIIHNIVIYVSCATITIWHFVFIGKTDNSPHYVIVMYLYIEWLYILIYMCIYIFFFSRVLYRLCYFFLLCSRCAFVVRRSRMHIVRKWPAVNLLRRAYQRNCYSLLLRS